MIRTSYAGDSHYGANEEASPCAPGAFRMGAPLTDRDLATARGRSIEGMDERGGTGEEGAAGAERVRCEIIRTSYAGARREARGFPAMLAGSG